MIDLFSGGCGNQGTGGSSGTESDSYLGRASEKFSEPSPYRLNPAHTFHYAWHDMAYWLNGWGSFETSVWPVPTSEASRLSEARRAEGVSRD